jgi:Domain of unknown function (DUF4129)
VRSRIDVLLPALLVLASVTWLLAAAPAPDATPASAPASAPTNGSAFQASEIRRAIDVVKADPNLNAERSFKTLKWKNPYKPQKRSDGFGWIANLVRWFNQSARLLVWAAAAILIVVLAMYIVRFFGGYRGSRAQDTFVAPTHVRDLDIRPETLPADIGAAARALWDEGEQRAALALLYRGMLSRLAHVHRVPIRDSSTEGDCLALAAQHLTRPNGREYTASLVRVWQRAVYGRESVQTATVHTLCDDFAAALNAPDALPLHPANAGGTA